MVEHKTKTWKFWENLKKLSINKTQDCVDEWEAIDFEDYNEYNDIIEDEEQLNMCICSQKHLIHIFFFKNKYNDNVIRIGSKCIKQFLKNQYEILLNEREEYMIERKEINRLINKRCERCKSHVSCKKDILQRFDKYDENKIKYIYCKSCSFLYNYDYSKSLKKGYDEWLIKNKDNIIINSMNDRIMKFYKLKKENENEISILEQKYLDIDFILQNNYNL
jgi:Pyruvate/2-oxoacid:ferredoxin oxidoreductase delta subunit